ncbi:MAG: hypothetical protein ACRDZ3_05615 [Acidimicrobiia bacterium]
MTPNGFPGGQAIFIFIPLAFLGLALWVLTIAVRDPAGRPKGNSLPKLPNPNSHPLHHVRVSMASTKRKAKVAARKAQAARPPPEQGGDEAGPVDGQA